VPLGQCRRDVVVAVDRPVVLHDQEAVPRRVGRVQLFHKFDDLGTPQDSLKESTRPRGRSSRLRIRPRRWGAWRGRPGRRVGGRPVQSARRLGPAGVAHLVEEDCNSPLPGAAAASLILCRDRRVSYVVSIGLSGFTTPERSPPRSAPAPAQCRRGHAPEDVEVTSDGPQGPTARGGQVSVVAISRPRLLAEALASRSMIGSAAAKGAYAVRPGDGRSALGSPRLGTGQPSNGFPGSRGLHQADLATR